MGFNLAFLAWLFLSPGGSRVTGEPRTCHPIPRHRRTGHLPSRPLLPKSPSRPVGWEPSKTQSRLCGCVSVVSVRVSVAPCRCQWPHTAHPVGGDLCVHVECVFHARQHCHYVCWSQCPQAPLHAPLHTCSWTPDSHAGTLAMCGIQSEPVHGHLMT